MNAQELYEYLDDLIDEDIDLNDLKVVYTNLPVKQIDNDENTLRLS